jgi:prolyl-tRNA editing enzyme YbaK/EbsC (Cys-tRNA(Pro) deacylase)
VSTKNLARQIGAKSVEPCKPEVANRHSGYLVVIGASSIH